MSGAPSQKAMPLQIPFPSGGLNYLDAPTDIKPNEAADLINFYPMHEGLRQAPGASVAKTPSGSIGSMLSYFDLSGASHYVWCIDHQIWIDGSLSSIYDGATDHDGHLIAITNDIWWLSSIGSYLQFTNGVDAPIRYDLSTGFVYQFNTWTVPAGFTVGGITEGAAYKQRWYGLLDSGNIGYGGLQAVTAALTAWPVRYAMKESAGVLFFTPWTYNQGLTNEELFVVVCTSGEVLVFSGGWPGSPDWQLVGRTKIPLPLGKNAFTLYGQDIYIATVRGVISLAKVFQGQNQDANLYQMSRNLGTSIALSPNSQIALSYNAPLMFVANASNDGYIYAMNTETGAWCKLASGISSTYVLSMAYGGGYLWICTNNLAGTKKIYKMTDTGAVGGSDVITSTWQTPYIDFGTNLNKAAKVSRLILSKALTGSSGTVSQSIAGDFSDSFATADARTLPVAATFGNCELELTPPGRSEHLSYKTILTSTGRVGLMYGLHVWVEQAGVY